MVHKSISNDGLWTGYELVSQRESEVDLTLLTINGLYVKTQKNKTKLNILKLQVATMFKLVELYNLEN